MSAAPQPVLDALIVYCAGLSAAHGKATFGFEPRRRFALVFREDYGSRSAVVFVELSTGDLYHADSWKARGRRTGSNLIFDLQAKFTAILTGIKP